MPKPKDKTKLEMWITIDGKKFGKYAWVDLHNIPKLKDYIKILVLGLGVRLKKKGFLTRARELMILEFEDLQTLLKHERE